MTGAGARDDAVLAAWMARAAGERLLTARANGQKDGAAGDRLAQAFLAGALSERRPGDAVLSEEAADGPARLGARRVWIIDPLDGTREYAEGRDDWAVHVALWVDGHLAAGAVALPARHQLFRTDTLSPRPGRARGGKFRLAVSRSRAPELVERVREQLAAVVRPMGSAGVKTMAVITGEVDAYVHAGGQYEWDSAAPVAVARAHGLHTSRVDGSPLTYNRPDPYLPDLLVCRTEDRARILEAIAVAAAPMLELI